MVTVKINNKSAILVASTVIQAGTSVFSCSWSVKNGDNIFYLPKRELSIDEALNVNDMFSEVSLSGFGEYIKSSDDPNTYLEIDYDNQKISFIAIKLIKKEDAITYNYTLQNFSDVKIQ
jgi:hypothetical protein